MSGGALAKFDARTRVAQLSGALSLPYRAATSKPAQRAYVSGILLFVGTCAVLCASSISFFVLYYAYVPAVGATHVVHLQFGQGHPHGAVDLGGVLVAQQAYDISLALHVPRTAANLATGNFMVDVALYAADAAAPSPADLLRAAAGDSDASGVGPLARARRPAILTHESYLVATARTLANLPLFVLGWKRESEQLHVGMFEGATFARGRAGVPARALVLIEADDKMQFYGAALHVRARFGGLRSLLYHHRVLSYLVFTAGFFCVSVASLLMAYLALGLFATAANDGEVKQEEDEEESEDAKDPMSTAGLSDTSRQFPTRYGQAPLRYSRRDGEDVVVKQEADEPAGIHPLTTEADDEDDDDSEGGAGSWRDSGIGTGRESDQRSIQRRRKSSRDGGF